MVTFFTFALINRQMDLDQKDISILQADLNRLRRLSTSTSNPDQNNGKLDQSKTASPVEKPQHRSHNIEENWAGFDTTIEICSSKNQLMVPSS